VTEAIAAREEEEKGNAMKARRALVAASAAGAARGRGREWLAPGTWLGVCQPGLPSAQAPVAARAAVTGAGRPKPPATSNPPSTPDLAGWRARRRWGTALLSEHRMDTPVALIGRCPNKRRRVCSPRLNGRAGRAGAGEPHVGQQARDGHHERAGRDAVAQQAARARGHRRRAGRPAAQRGERAGARAAISPARPPARAPQRAVPPLATGRPDRVSSSTWAAARERLRTEVQERPPQPRACLAGGRPEAGAARIIESLSWAKLALPRQNRPCRVRGGEPSAARSCRTRRAGQHTALALGMPCTQNIHLRSLRLSCCARKRPLEEVALVTLCTKRSV